MSPPVRAQHFLSLPSVQRFYIMMCVDHYILWGSGAGFRLLVLFLVVSHGVINCHQCYRQDLNRFLIVWLLSVIIFTVHFIPLHEGLCAVSRLFLQEQNFGVDYVLLLAVKLRSKNTGIIYHVLKKYSGHDLTVLSVSCTGWIGLHQLIVNPLLSWCMKSF